MALQEDDISLPVGPAKLLFGVSSTDVYWANLSHQFQSFLLLVVVLLVFSMFLVCLFQSWESWNDFAQFKLAFSYSSAGSGFSSVHPSSGGSGFGRSLSGPRQLVLLHRNCKYLECSSLNYNLNVQEPRSLTKLLQQMRKGLQARCACASHCCQSKACSRQIDNMTIHFNIHAQCCFLALHLYSVQQVSK